VFKIKVQFPEVKIMFLLNIEILGYADEGIHKLDEAIVVGALSHLTSFYNYCLVAS